MLAALKAPFMKILSNAGDEVPDFKINEVLDHDPGMVYDVMQHALLDAQEAGLLDPAEIVIEGLRSAVSAAMMALSVETIVLQKNPEMSYDP